mgnify:CR=1 FL=1
MRMFAYTTECDFVISIHQSEDAFRFDLDASQGEKVVELDLPTDKVEFAIDSYNFRDGYQWFDYIKSFRK